MGNPRRNTQTHRYKNPHGRGRVWVRSLSEGKTKFYIDYYVDGRKRREATDAGNVTEARKVLADRIGEREKGIPVRIDPKKVRFDTLSQDLRQYYSDQRKRNTYESNIRLAHLERFFGKSPVVAITPERIRSYIRHRRSHGVKDATIQRELSILSKLFKVALRDGKIHHAPYIESLGTKARQGEARKGYFTREDVVFLLPRLPEHFRPVLRFGFITGWRIPSEVLTLKWNQVDLKEGIVTTTEETKTDEAREFDFVYFPELREILEEVGNGSEYVFHKEGRPLFTRRDYDGTIDARSWQRAFTKAVEGTHLEGFVPHQLRHSAVRNLRDAGVPDDVARQMTGHKTTNVYERYGLARREDRRRAAKKLAEHLSSPQTGHTGKKQEKPPLKVVR